MQRVRSLASLFILYLRMAFCHCNSCHDVVDSVDFILS